MVLVENSTDFQRRINLNTLQIFPWIAKEGITPDVFYETTVILIPRLHKEPTKKLLNNFLYVHTRKKFNRIFATQIQEHITNSSTLIK